MSGHRAVAAVGLGNFSSCLKSTSSCQFFAEARMPANVFGVFWLLSQLWQGWWPAWRVIALIASVMVFRVWSCSIRTLWNCKHTEHYLDKKIGVMWLRFSNLSPGYLSLDCIPPSCPSSLLLYSYRSWSPPKLLLPLRGLGRAFPSLWWCSLGGAGKIIAQLLFVWPHLWCSVVSGLNFLQVLNWILL